MKFCPIIFFMADLLNNVEEIREVIRMNFPIYQDIITNLTYYNFS